MAAGEKEGSSFARWWEFYAVRYGVGTAIGAVLVLFLCQSIPELQPLLIGQEVVGIGAGSKVLLKLDSPLLFLLAGYGLVFCYLSSAPILVFHMGRSFAFENKEEKNRGSVNQPDENAGTKKHRSVISKCFGMMLGVVVGLGLVAVLFFLLCANSEKYLHWRYSWGVMVVVGVGVVVCQFYFVREAVRRLDFLFDFYRNLSSARDCYSGSLIESYKHLREHGNAFFIVVMELVLAGVIFGVGVFGAGVVGIAIAIFIWVLPAARVWWIGSLLERAFMKQPLPQQQINASNTCSTDTK
ncbi:hypothetical protein NJI34_37755 [Pseudomonas sp. S 311-6]|nr:hypothetical protein [Pseudomonas sp. S 311-6]